jgi:hypothetical protein
MQDFHKEIQENININQTFSIEDISEEKCLNRFYIIGEEVEIEAILEDSEFLTENTEKLLQRLETVLQDSSSNIVMTIVDCSGDAVDALVDCSGNKASNK